MRQIDLYDVGIVAGLGLLGVGLWFVNPALVLVAAGIGVISAMVLHARSHSRRR